MDPISHAFVDSIERFARQHQVEVVAFRKGERKDDVAAGYLKAFAAEEGVLSIGKAQEKTPVFRTERGFPLRRRWRKLAPASPTWRIQGVQRAK